MALKSIMKKNETVIHTAHSSVRLFTTPWTIAHQAPLSMKFSRQEYCSGLQFSSPKSLNLPSFSGAHSSDSYLR